MSFCSSFLQFHKKLEVNPLLHLNTLHFSDETLAQGLGRAIATARLSDVQLCPSSLGWRKHRQAQTCSNLPRRHPLFASSSIGPVIQLPLLVRCFVSRSESAKRKRKSTRNVETIHRRKRSRPTDNAAVGSFEIRKLKNRIFRRVCPTRANRIFPRRSKTWAVRAF